MKEGNVPPFLHVDSPPVYLTDIDLSSTYSGVSDGDLLVYQLPCDQWAVFRHDLRQLLLSDAQVLKVVC